MSDSLTLVPYEHVERARRRYEQEQIRKARNRWHWDSDDRITHHDHPRFVGWDGEGPRDAGYALFGNSDGDEICLPFITTTEALDLIIDHKRRNPDTISVWFGGDYDVSMILGSLPRRNMTALHEFSRTVWNGYEIEHIPHKWFWVRHGEISVRMYDIHSFFDSGYADALVSWKIGTPEEQEAIKAGKARRAEFLWIDIDSIRDYFRLELKLMPLLCEKLREVFKEAGYVPRSWHGPGALARMALSRHGIYDAMAEPPQPVADAARMAFAGGRFELFWAGHVEGKVWNYDIHSAYPYFATRLPDLARGKWRHTDSFEPERFGVYRITYEHHNPDSFRMYPLFRRMSNAGVAWPWKVSGWYWNPEAELVASDPDAVIHEGWVFDEEDPENRPFSFLREYYERRRELKRNGQAAEYTFKLIINAIYGQLAQRVGWNRRTGAPPRTHQLEWAGYITSSCRAAIYRAAMTNPEKIISLDTDGLYSMVPLDGLELGDGLGEWEAAEYDDGIFWQSGVYCLKKGDVWEKAKTRGIPKGTYTPEDLLERVRGSKEPFKVWKNVFVGYGLADNGQWEKRNTWERKEHEYIFGGTGKRSHIGRFGRCNRNCRGNLHALGSIPVPWPDDDGRSEPHYLPWKDNSKGIIAAKQLGYFVFSQEDPDSEEIGWLKQERERSAHVAGQSTTARKLPASPSSHLTESPEEYAETASNSYGTARRKIPVKKSWTRKADGGYGHAGNHPLSE